MRAHLLVGIFLVTLASCRLKAYVYSTSQTFGHIGNEQRFGDLSHGFPDMDSTVDAYLENESIKSSGKYAMTVEKQVSNIKTGEWKEYYDNGQIRSEGTYKVSSYLNCCISGPCREYYSYRDGLWKYFSEDGTLEYEVEFSPSKLHVSTNCEGGDFLIFGLIKSIPIKYRDSLTPEKVFELQKVLISDEIGYLTYTPVNGELHVRFIPRK